MTAVGRAVVGHDALDGDAMASKPAERAVEEGDGAGLALVGQDLAVGEPDGIADGMCRISQPLRRRGRCDRR